MLSVHPLVPLPPPLPGYKPSTWPYWTRSPFSFWLSLSSDDLLSCMTRRSAEELKERRERRGEREEHLAHARFVPATS